MTFKEAKKILEEEGFCVEKATRPCDISEPFTEYEDPTICEAMQVVCSAGYFISMEISRFKERKARLKKEYEENTKAPGPGEEHPKKGNSALKESASQFNDALLDEQAKKIKRLGKEISKLNSIIHDKNAVLSDVAEELRLTNIREKNLAELGLKYVGENEKLKKELADKVVDKIDAQALKSAESALAWKDEVIADLGKELEEANNRIKAIRNASKGYCDYGIAAEKMIQKMAKVIVEDRAIDSEDFEKYRLWANGRRFNPQLPDFSEEEKKLSSVKETHPTEDNPEEVEMDEILERVRKALEEGHTVSIDYDKAEEGGDQSATIVECGKDIDDVFEEIKRLCQE